MRAGLQRGAGCAGVIGGRARDVNEVGRFAREQQLEVLVNANIFYRAQGGLAPRGNRLVNRDDLDAGTLPPSGQMALLGDLAKAGNCTAKFQQRRSLIRWRNPTGGVSLLPHSPLCTRGGNEGSKRNGFV
jgi:hypothetical protein